MLTLSAAKRLRARAASYTPARKREGRGPLPRVFIVETDQGVRLSLVWLLEGLGAEVRAFASTQEFLDRFDGSAGCLLLDIGPHGIARLLQFNRELSSRHVALPVVAVSSDPFISAEEAQAAGAVDFLPKPFACEALIECLRGVRPCAIPTRLLSATS